MEPPGTETESPPPTLRRGVLVGQGQHGGRFVSAWPRGPPAPALAHESRGAQRPPHRAGRLRLLPLRRSDLLRRAPLAGRGWWSSERPCDFECGRIERLRMEHLCICIFHPRADAIHSRLGVHLGQQSLRPARRARCGPPCALGAAPPAAGGAGDGGSRLRRSVPHCALDFARRRNHLRRWARRRGGAARECVGEREREGSACVHR